MRQKKHVDFDVEAEDGRFLGRFFRGERVRVVLGNFFRSLVPHADDFEARVLGPGRAGTVWLKYRGIDFYADASMVHPIRVPKRERKLVKGQHGR